ncbi:DegT/DnrJ/EryC1/StrS family aminotransferase [Cryomorpha ignava]|uniref:DegT/DnrJ/EryC1/StrS family aminotransferase n=1 Tax=Cryomorpha ignava TaxID=101383 RepID=A0A7K3WXE8_9FLAO|nr:DegT/DnrJ/EryC1/StrS family aminotransferase [Cryomorpha ignava]NEN25532.1 DegT/DnrJ/EryC1/StrS family aminotransferase [Cryomorpha ignava]
MKKIQMVDLGSQYEKIQDEIDTAVLNVIRSCAYINGPEVKSFQSELESYLDVKHVIPCANGTDALQIAMMALGLKPGDEVITADFTYVATAEVIALLQLTPVLVDVDPDTFNIDVEAIKAAITPKTKAIVPVHLFGQAAPMEEIMAVAKAHNLYVIEDAAQAIGAEYTFSDGRKQRVGTIGDIGATSFFPSKNLGCYGDGGAIFTNNDTYAANLRVIANHGQTRQYYHDEVGVNSRLDSIQAAILRIKLRHLDEYSHQRNIAADFYDKAFKDIPQIKTPVRFKQSNHVFHQYTMILNGVDRETLRTYLMDRDVPAMIYYPVPLHLQKAYRDERYNEGDFPVTENLCENVISLPMQTELSTEQLTHITESVKSFIKNNYQS